MEALQKTNATHRGDTSPDRKLLDKELRKFGAQQEDSNYVDLDDLLAMKTEGTKTVKVTFTGEASQLAIFKSSSEAPVAARREREESARSACTAAKDCQANIEEPLSSETASSPEVPDSSDDFGDCVPSPDARGDKITERHQGIFPPNYNPKNVSFESEELHYTDMYLNSKSESEDSASVVLSDSRTPSTTEDESHYITTHEIQLLELDHDVDHDFGQGSRWDIEDDNLVYSFVDYASFDSDETIEEVQVLEDISVAKVPSQPVQSKNDNSMMCAPGDDAVKHDLCDSEKFGSSDESLLKNPNSSGNAVGQIHLSIKATSRAINEQRNIPEKENLNGYIFKSPNAKVEAICDRASCFIPAPGRVHIGSKLKGKDINEYSSGASSSISELDDADKEVRNLTTRAFRSLACPYFNAINFSTSSESSASEHGLGVNRLQDQSPDSHSNQGDAKRHSVQLGKKPAIMETQSPDSPTATIYHHSLPMAAQGAQPQIFCFSPSVPPVATSSLDTFQQTQRKMLLDPTTGHYYLVETPVHPATRRLFDPETGQYVDVPMPQQCVTPVPMPVSPLALSPGTYGPTYIYYPGFAPSSATVTTGTDGGGEKSSSREATPGGQQAEAPCWETPYYSHTGQPTQGQLVPQFVTSRVNCRWLDMGNS
ncbi:hypothetical protein GN956_G12698 [Arapaima gigas]